LSPCTTSGQEMERVNSYNPGARTGLLIVCLTAVWKYTGQRTSDWTNYNAALAEVCALRVLLF